jgi:hypothetical protein
MDLVDFFVVLGLKAQNNGEEMEATVLTHYPEEEGDRTVPPHLTMVRIFVVVLDAIEPF